MKPLLYILLVTFAFVACSPVKQVAVKSESADTVRVYITDTLFVSNQVTDKSKSTTKDSIRESTTERTTVVVNDRGDTLRTDKTTEIVKDRYLKEENERLLSVIDSLSSVIRESEKKVSKTDTQTPIIVEKPLNWWQRLKLEVGGTAIGLLLAIVIFGIVWIVRRRR